VSRTIVVNATALQTSGGLTILKQFVEAAKKQVAFEFIVFISPNLEFKNEANIKFQHKDLKRWIQRILWDSFGLNRWLKDNDIRPDYVVSLQNTTINVDFPQIVYLHQPIPYSEIEWSLFRRSEFKFFLYKKFYKKFIYLHSRDDTIYTVQTFWMKRALAADGISDSRIHVIKPTVAFGNSYAASASASTPFLFYPATSMAYKNHSVILKAMRRLNTEFRQGVEFKVTLSRGESPSFDRIVDDLELGELVEYLGVIDHDAMVSNYIGCLALVFPSYIETLGLPLLEAASLGCPILASDLDFARDVLNGYEGVQFIDHTAPDDWVKAIGSLIKEKAEPMRYPRFDYNGDGWEKFFNLMEN